MMRLPERLGLKVVRALLKWCRWFVDRLVGAKR